MQSQTNWLLCGTVGIKGLFFYCSFASELRETHVFAYKTITAGNTRWEEDEKVRDNRNRFGLRKVNIGHGQ